MPRRALSLVLCLAWACSPETPTLAPSRGVILVSLDTMSAEHMSVYGYERPTTPFLEQLGARGAVFDHAYVQLPGTLPSHMSMFTGLYPDQHDVFPPDSVLSPEIPTIPEVLQARGFRTIGFTEGGFVSGRYGFERGFDVFSDERILIWSGGDHVFKKGLRELDGLPAERPFFLFLHTYAVHDPYTPPKHCASLFWPGEPPEGAGMPTSQVLRHHNLGLSLLEPSTVEYYRSLYDAEIRCLDEELERFFTAVEAMGRLENTTIIVTADHGEEFLEHGKMAHEQIYNENLHVPLIVLHPGITPGRRSASVVESVDLAPTIYEALDVEAPPALPGRSLVPQLLEPSRRNDLEAFSRSFDGNRSLVALSPRGLYHYVRLRNEHLARGEPIPVASRGSIRIPPGRTELAARSFLEPVDLEIALDGTATQRVALEPDQWTPVTVENPGPGTALLSLSSRRCVPNPQALAKGLDRCVSFLVRGLPGDVGELYRIDEDRAEQVDLSTSEPGIIEMMARRREAARWQPFSTADQEALEGPLEDDLRALGYVD